jgi:hypothetical protein
MVPFTGSIYDPGPRYQLTYRNMPRIYHISKKMSSNLHIMMNLKNITQKMSIDIL